MVANAKAHDAKRLTGRFSDPKDKKEARAFVGSFSGYEHNAFFANTQVGAGAPGYVEAGFAAGLDFDHDGRAVAPIDVDGDGDLDLALLTLQGLHLMLNDAAPPGDTRRWIRLGLRATRTEPLALGAQVVVRSRVGGVERAQLDRVRLTAGFHAQVSPELHFGLGAADRVESVEVRWPSGETQRFAGLDAGRRYLIVEGEPTATTRPAPSWPASARPAVDRDYDLRLVTDGAGRPTVVNFWAPWCAACEREVPALAALHGEWGEAVGLVGATVPGAAVGREGPDAVGAFVARHGLRYPMVQADDAMARSFFGVGGQLTLPATFVFDRHGRLARAFYREVNAAELRAAVAGLSVATVPQDHVGLAISRARARKHGEAVVAFEQALAENTRSPLTWWRAGVTALNAGDAAGAIEALQTSVRLNPEDAEAWTDLAQAHQRAGDPAARERALEKALGLGVPSARAHHLMGELLLKRGAYTRAIVQFRAALADDPTLLVSWRGLAAAQQASGLAEDAEDSRARFRAESGP